MIKCVMGFYICIYAYIEKENACIRDYEKSLETHLAKLATIEKSFATMMGLHERLGKGSNLRRLDLEVARLICSQFIESAHFMQLPNKRRYPHLLKREVLVTI